MDIEHSSQRPGTSRLPGDGRTCRCGAHAEARAGHPLNVTLRQDAVPDPLDAWLAGKFGPRHLPAAIDELAAAATIPERARPAAEDDTEARIGDCDHRLTQYRAALDAGADPASVAKWITETESEKARLRATVRPAAPRPAMTREEIETTVNALAGLLAVIRDAGPPDKAEIYTRLGLKLTYQPAGLTVRTEVNMMSAAQHWLFESVRGGT
jgi:site-specific DNA recombinase